MRNLTETLELIKSNKLSPTEHLEEILKNIKEDENINSFITLDIDGARKMASESYY